MKKVIGIDLGYGHVKTISRDKNGEVREQISESIVGTFDQGIEVEGLKSEMEIVPVDGEKYIVGKAALKHSARILNGRDKGWIESTAYKVLLTAGLAKAEPNAQDLIVITGLPVTFYKSDKAKLEGIIRHIAQPFCVNLTIKILPQPVGSFFSMLFNERGEIKNEKLLAGKTGVLDIGYYTTDLITLDELELVEKQMDSFENGVSTALESIGKDIADEHGARLDLHAVEQAVKKGTIRLYGEEIDITRAANRRLAELAAEIASKVKTAWKIAADIDRVILTGGGSALLNGRLNMYRHAHVIDNAQFANAHGYFNFGERHAKEG